MVPTYSMETAYSEVLDGDNVLESTGLGIYNQLLLNGLADPLGMELLEL